MKATEEDDSDPLLGSRRIERQNSEERKRFGGLATFNVELQERKLDENEAPKHGETSAEKVWFFRLSLGACLRACLTDL